MEYYDMTIFAIKVLIGVIVLLVVIFGVIRPLLKNATQIPEKTYPSRPIHGHRIEEDEIEIPSPKQPAEDPNKKIIQMALDNTNQTSLLVRNWLQEKK